MEARLSFNNLIRILNYFDAILNDKIKAIDNHIDNTQAKFDLSKPSSYRDNEQNNQYDNNLLFREDLCINIIKLLKNEDNSSVFEHIKNKGELIYYSRQGVSKFEVITRQKKFYQFFKIFLKNLQKNNGKIYNINSSNNIHKNTYDSYLIYCNNKLDFENFFTKYFDDEMLKQKDLLKFIKEFYILIRLFKVELEFLTENQSEDFFKHIAKELEERMNLSFYYIGKRNYLEEDFELHKAVFENNLRMIRKICALETTCHIFSDINEIDPNGNTPLMLAIKLENYDAINVLCDHDADVKHKSFEGDTSPLEYALTIKNRKILKILINALKKQKLTHWENNKYDILKLFKSIPDFSLELKLNFDSNILSLFSSITPSDYYKFYKLGGNIRIDMNISSINSSFKSIKGKCSIVIQEKGNKINIYKIDHEKKISYDYIDYLTNIADEDKKVEQMIEEGLITNKIFTKDISLKAEKQKKEEKIVTFTTKKYTAKGLLYIIKEKFKKDENGAVKNINSKNVNNKIINKEQIENCLKNKFINFSEYFNYGVKNRNYSTIYFDILNNKIDDIVKDNNHINRLNNIDDDLHFNKNKKNNLKKLSSSKNLNNRKKSLGSDLQNNQQDYLQTDHRTKNQSDSEYEIEYIEKLKKTGNAKILKKQIEMSVWLSDEFPLKLSHFIPLLHILSFTSSEFSQLKSAICSNFLPFESFPLKITFPLGLSFYALLQVTNFSLKPPNISVFEVNYENKKEYNYADTINLLDEKYAKDFYDRYYMEKHNDDQNEDSDNSSMNERIREIFYTDEGQVANYNTISYINKDSNNRQIKLYTKNSDENLSNGYEDSVSQLDVTTIGVRENSNKNDAASLAFEELKIKYKNNYANTNNFIKSSSGRNKILPDLDIKQFQITTDIDKEEEVPNEKLKNEKQNTFKLPFSPTPRRKEKVCYSKSSTNEIDDVSQFHSDDSQKTLKCNFNPKLIKNLKNFLKYKSNNTEQELIILSENSEKNSVISNFSNKNNPKVDMKRKCMIF